MKLNPSLALLLPLLPLATATREISPSALVSDIHSNALTKNLWNLAEIAKNNGGNRAFGLPGYRASVDFIVKRLRTLKNLEVREQEFETLFAIVDEIDLREAGSESDVYVHGLTYSPSTSAEGLTAELVLGPEGAAGCDVAGYEGLDVRDKVVLVQRFRCPDQSTLVGRVRPAVAAGAAAVIIYHDLPTTPTSGNLSGPDPVGLRPSGFIRQADGEAWKARLEAGEKIEVFFKHLQTIENRTTWNVFAETKTGDPNTVVMAGAHLDSVQAGAGINDDGSGTSVVLELATAANKYRTRNKLRFAWWGAEENGLRGSRHYVADLADPDFGKILAYLNFDMVSRGFFGVFDGDGSTHGLVAPAGSEVIEDLFMDYLVRRERVETTPIALSGGTDYVPFLNRGLAVGGLFTGTGFEQDPCYHQPCDGYENHNATVLFKNAKAGAHVLARLAVDGHKLIPRWSPSAAVSDARLATFAEENHATHGCEHDEF
ncbi:hypothetical protein AX16_006833 [Volvariella volvacea WC 439]|nr:hypothetical protein AX16_006833 [Volvariella volvacea WC 439]